MKRALFSVTNVEYSSTGIDMFPSLHIVLLSAITSPPVWSPFHFWLAPTLLQVRALASRAIRIRQAAAGRAHTLFLSDTGTVFTCGSDVFGQCGGAGAANQAPSFGYSHGQTEDRSVSSMPDSKDEDGGNVGAAGTSTASAAPAPDILAPRVVGGGLSDLRVESVSAGDDHCTAITAPVYPDNTTTTTTTNDDDDDDACSATATGAGGGHSMSVDNPMRSDSRVAMDLQRGERSRVFSWGLNKAGQCAQGRAAEVVRTPQEAELLSGARAVGCGAGHMLVVL